MYPPKLEGNKCSVLIAAHATGHVFKKDLTRFSTGDNEEDIFQLFDNFQNAEYFVLNFIKSKPEFECSIFDENGAHLKTYDKKGERKFTDKG